MMNSGAFLVIAVILSKRLTQSRRVANSERRSVCARGVIGSGCLRTREVVGTNPEHLDYR